MKLKILIIEIKEILQLARCRRINWFIVTYSMKNTLHTVVFHKKNIYNWRSLCWLQTWSSSSLFHSRREVRNVNNLDITIAISIKTQNSNCEFPWNNLTQALIKLFLTTWKWKAYILEQSWELFFLMKKKTKVKESSYRKQISKLCDIYTFFKTPNTQIKNY